MKKYIVLFVICGLLSFNLNAVADIIIKVNNSSTDSNGLEEKVYGVDNVGIAVEGEEPADGSGYRAHEISDTYFQSLSGLRYLKRWDSGVFKGPVGVITTETISSVVIMNFQNYLLKDNFEAFSIEYNIKVFNRGPVFVGNLLFYKGAMLATPQKIIFHVTTKAPPAFQSGKSATTWGNIKAR